MEQQRIVEEKAVKKIREIIEEFFEKAEKAENLELTFVAGTTVVNSKGKVEPLSLGIPIHRSINFYKKIVEMLKFYENDIRKETFKKYSIMKKEVTVIEIADQNRSVISIVFLTRAEEKWNVQKILEHLK